jgi:excinuclease UvrABC nuclease subunit
VTKEEYRELIRLAQQILNGNIKNACGMLERSMEEFAEKENYEAAAKVPRHPCFA